MPPPYKWIRAPEAAAFIGVSESQLRALAKNAEIPHLTGPLRFDQCVLTKWVESRLERSAPARSAPAPLKQAAPEQAAEDTWQRHLRRREQIMERRRKALGRQ